MARPKEFEEKDVLQKAMECFWEKGYYQASIQDLVDRMQINRASLYGAFKDKYQLYLRCLEQYRQQEVAKYLALFQQNMPIQFFESVFNNVIDGMVNDKLKKGCFITNATLEMLPEHAEVQILVAKNLAFVEEIFTMAITNGVKHSEIYDEINAPEISKFLISQLYGIRVYGKAISEKNVLENLKKHALNSLR